MFSMEWINENKVKYFTNTETNPIVECIRNGVNKLESTKIEQIRGILKDELTFEGEYTEVKMKDYLVNNLFIAFKTQVFTENGNIMAPDGRRRFPPGWPSAFLLGQLLIVNR